MKYEITVIIDSREKTNKNILDYFDKHNIKYVIKKLDFGDYSCVFVKDGIEYSLTNVFSIERKKNIAELIQNLCGADKNHRRRFEEEWQRVEQANARMELLMEDEAWYRKIITGDYGNGYYKSKASKKAIRASLSYFQQRYNFSVVGVDSSYSGAWIIDRLIWACKSFMLKNNIYY